MKRFSLLLLAAVLGSALTIGTYRYLDSRNENPFKIQYLSDTPVVGAAYTVKENGEIVPLKFTDVAKEVMPAVVNIKSTQVSGTSRKQDPRSEDPMREFFNDDFFRHFFGPDYQQRSPQSQRAPQPRVGTGSGVIIDPNGYIVTNNHVISGADDIEVTLDDNRVFKAKVIGTDPTTDLALIQIKEKDLPHLPLMNSDEVEVGEWVLAVGNPFNLNSTVTAGIVSAKGRNINILRDRSAIESFIQTDAAINPGNSGGALVNLQGGLVGINTAIASPTGAYAGYGFAIPANIVGKVVSDLQKFGMVQRGYLGLLIRSVDGNLAREKELEVTRGVYVDSSTVKTDAGEAGILEGDVITGINGKEVNTSAQLLEIIGSHYPGDELSLEVNRKGKTMDYQVTLRNQDGETRMKEPGSEGVLDILGIELEETENGLRVSELSDGKLKRETDMRPGFIITSVDGKKIDTVEKFTKYLEGKEGGVLLEGIYEDYPGTYYYAFGL